MATHDAGHRRPDAQARHRARGRPRRARPGAGRLRLPELTSTDRSDPDRELSSMQLRYVFSELGQGLRRNLSMHLAVILTLFVSLTLVGLGVLLNQQADKAAEHWGSQLQITVFLCTATRRQPGLHRRGDRGAEGRDRRRSSRTTPRSRGYHIESKEEAFEKVKELLGPEKFEGPNPAATAEDMPQSVWIDARGPRGVRGHHQRRAAASTASPASATCARCSSRSTAAINALQVGRARHAAFLVVAALLLVANTIRLAALARRKRDRHHAAGGRLDALHRAAVPARGAGDRADRRRARRPGRSAPSCTSASTSAPSDQLKFMPWIGLDEYIARRWRPSPILGPLLTLLPTLVLTRKYLKVLIRSAASTRHRQHADLTSPNTSEGRPGASPSPVPLVAAWPHWRALAAVQPCALRPRRRSCPPASAPTTSRTSRSAVEKRARGSAARGPRGVQRAGWPQRPARALAGRPDAALDRQDLARDARASWRPPQAARRGDAGRADPGRGRARRRRADARPGPRRIASDQRESVASTDHRHLHRRATPSCWRSPRCSTPQTRPTSPAARATRVIVGTRDPGLRRAHGRRGAARGPRGAGRRRPRTTVAAKARAAAEHVEVMQALEAEPQAAKDDGRPAGRASARGREAGVARGQAARPPSAAEAQEGGGRRIEQLLAERAARRAPARAARAAASANARRAGEPQRGFLDPPGRRLRHVAVRLAHPPDLRLLRPAQRHRLRRRLRRAAVAAAGGRVVAKYYSSSTATG